MLHIWVPAIILVSLLASALPTAPVLSAATQDRSIATAAAPLAIQAAPVHAQPATAQAQVLAGMAAQPHVATTIIQTSAPMQAVTVATLAGGQSGSGDGIGSNAQFNSIADVALSKDETFALIADEQNHTIRRLNLSNNQVTTYAGRANISGSADGPVNSARFNTPNEIEISHSGTFALVIDSVNYTIRRLDLLNNTVSTVAGVAGSPGEQNGVGNAARFRRSTSLAISPDDRYALISEEGSGNVRKIDLTSSTASTYLDLNPEWLDWQIVYRSAGIAISPDASFALISASQFSSPILYRVNLANAATTQIVTPDTYRNIIISPDQRYALLTEKDSLRRLDLQTNTFTILAGKPMESGAVDGPGDVARFTWLSGIDISRDGSFALVADSTTIRRVVDQSTPRNAAPDADIVYPPNVPDANLINGEIPANYPLADITLPDAAGNVVIGGFTDGEVAALYETVNSSDPSALPSLRFPMVIRGLPGVQVGSVIAVNFTNGATARITQVIRRSNFTLIQAELLIPKIDTTSALQSVNQAVTVQQATLAQSSMQQPALQSAALGTQQNTIYIPSIATAATRSGAQLQSFSRNLPGLPGCEVAAGLKASSLKVEGGNIGIEPVAQLFEPTVVNNQPARRIRLGARALASIDASFNLTPGEYGELKCKLGPEINWASIPAPLGPLAPLASVKAKTQPILGLEVAGEGLFSGTFRLQCNLQTAHIQGADFTANQIAYYQENPITNTSLSCINKSSGLASNIEGAAKLNIKLDYGAETKIGLQIGGRIVDGINQVSQRIPVIGRQMQRLTNVLFLDVFKVKTVARLDFVHQNTRHLLGRVYADGSRKNESKFNGGFLLEGKIENDSFSKLVREVGLNKLFEFTVVNYNLPLVQLYRPLKGEEIKIDDSSVGAYAAFQPDRSRTVHVGTVHQDMAVYPSPFSGTPPAVENGNAPPVRGELWYEQPSGGYTQITALQPQQVTSLQGTLLLSPAQCRALPANGGTYHLIGYNKIFADLEAPGYLGKIRVMCEQDGYTFRANTVDVGTEVQGMPAYVEGKECDAAGNTARGVELLASITPQPVDEWRTESAQLFLDGQPVATNVVQTPSQYSLKTVADLNLPKGNHTLILVAQLKSADGTRTREARYMTTFEARPKSCVVAEPDVFTVDKCQTTLLNVLANDFLPGLSPFASQPQLTIVGLRNTSQTSNNAQASITPDKKTVAFSPGSAGSWTFEYEVKDTQNGSDTAQVTVIAPEAPCAPPGSPNGGGGGTGNPNHPGGPGGPNGGGGNGWSPTISWGDPHVRTADGRRFISNALGEFTAFRSRPGEPALLMQVRQELARATSVLAMNTAFAVQIYGSRVEFYIQPQPRILVNGEVFTGNYIDLGGTTLTVTYSIDGGYASAVLVGGGKKISVTRYGYLNIAVNVPLDGSVQGLYGIPDGNADNDMSLPDGSVTTDPWALAEAWRVRERAESLFTYAQGEGPGTYNRPNPFRDQMPSAAELAPFRAQAEGLVASACAPNPSKPVDQELLNDLSLDLSLGFSANEMVEQLCTYEIAGVVRDQATGTIPLAGVKVNFSSPQLAPCQAITDAGGFYRCVMKPVPNTGTPTVTIQANGMADVTYAFPTRALAYSSLAHQQNLTLAVPTLKLQVRAVSLEGTPRGKVALNIAAHAEQVTNNDIRQLVTNDAGVGELIIPFPSGTANAVFSVRVANEAVNGNAQNGQNVRVALNAGETVHAVEITLQTPANPGGDTKTFASVTVSTLAGVANDSRQVDGIGRAARFRQPRALAISPNGAFALMTDGADVVRRIDLTTGAVTTIATLSSRSDDTIGIAISPDSTYALLTQSMNCVVQRLNLQTNAITTIAGQPNACVSPVVNGIGPAARFYRPRDIAIHPTGQYALVVDGPQIRRLDLQTNAVSTIVGSGLAGNLDGNGTAARIGTPKGIAISADGTFALVTEAFYHHNVRRIDLQTNQVTTIAGSTADAGSAWPSPNAGTADGIGPAARFNQPLDITISRDNTFALVSDYGNHTLRRIDLQTNAVTTIAGQAGTWGTADGAGEDARFANPWGIALSPDTSFALVADMNGKTIRKVTSN